MRRDRIYPGQEEIPACHVLHGCRRNRGGPSRTRPIEPGRTEGSRVARVPVQHGSTNLGGAGCVPTSKQFVISRARRAARQGTQESCLPLVAGNGCRNQGAAEATTAYG